MIAQNTHPADLDGGLSLPADQSAGMYHVWCEDCPESAVIGPFGHARYAGRCHAHFRAHQVIVEVWR
jgi:hypothetical protein